MSVLLLGLDGTPWSILKKWMAEGQLPIIKRIFENSVRGNLESTIPTYTSPALPTLFTGKSQGKTGIFGFTYADGTPVSLRTMRDAKIWDIIGENRKKSCIVNVRMLYPVEELNGVMISGNPASSEDSDYVYPREMKEKIRGFRHEEINRLSEELTVDPQANKEEILSYRIKMTKSRYDVFKDLNSEKDYDFSFFWIGGTDFMGHWFWDDEDTYLRYFKEVDHILEDVLKTFNGRSIIIISDHGMQGVQTRKFFVNTWLERIGYVKYGGHVITRTLRKKFAPRISHLLSKENKERLERMFGRNEVEDATMRDSCTEHKDAFEKLKYGYIHGIDWANTKAYLASNWGISLRVDPGSDVYHRIREDIIEKMGELRGEDGKKIVKKVWKKEEIFNGPYLDQLPDIVFILTEDYGMGVIPSSKIAGAINKDQYGRGRGRYFRGDHEGAIDGIIMAYGPDFRSGEVIENAKIVDIMPTVLNMLKVGIPDDIDGIVLKDLFKKESSHLKRDIKKRHYGDIKSEAKSLSCEENHEIIESLKQMGYM